MTKDLKPGTKVTWSSHAGEAHGEVVKKLTKATQIKGHKVAATADDPQFLVETEKGSKAAHKAAALHKD